MIRTVSLPIEILRTRPALIFWLATLAQAIIWILVPVIFYSSPPGDVPAVLALGHALRMGSETAPPLAYWLADLAFTTAGQHAFGVYLLSQICLIVAYWAIFSLGRATIGERHAVLAVLLMVGISLLTFRILDFGPSILAIPLWAFALLLLWRAAAENKPVYWYVLAIDIALLLLTTNLGLILVAVIFAFMAATKLGRAHATTPEAWIGLTVIAFAAFPNVYWLTQNGGTMWTSVPQFGAMNVAALLRLTGWLVAAHLGLGVLSAIALKTTRGSQKNAVVIEESPATGAARVFIYVFAFGPLLAAILLAAIFSFADPFADTPLVLLSGVVILTVIGARLVLHHQRVLVLTWAAFLIVPALVAGVVVLASPFTLAVDLSMSQPAAEMGRFFAENFERRTGKPLALVGGNQRLAQLVALGTARRPQVIPNDPKSPSDVKAIAEKGAIVVWPATDATGLPPADIKARFPDLVPELPRAFDRPILGRMPLLRLGWAMIRPTAP